jgi:hypothetical protein
MPLKRRTCLARLERSSAGKFGNEAGAALGAGGGQRSEDLPGTSAFRGFVTAGDFACDHRRTQLAFGQVVSGLNTVVRKNWRVMSRCHISLYLRIMVFRTLAY